LSPPLTKAVAVAEVGSLELDHTYREGIQREGLSGICNVVGPDVLLPVLVWDGDSYDCDRPGWRAWLKKNMTPAERTAHNRRLRGRVCGLMAGLVAEEIISGPSSNLPSNEIWIEPELVYSNHDLTKATAYCRFLLPFKDEYDSMMIETARALREPDVLQAVMQLADALEKSGRFGFNDEAIPHLPSPRKNWPKRPRRLA